MTSDYFPKAPSRVPNDTGATSGRLAFFPFFRDNLPRWTPAPRLRTRVYGISIAPGCLQRLGRTLVLTLVRGVRLPILTESSSYRLSIFLGRRFALTFREITLPC